MSVVDNLFNNNVPITITGGVELTANLAVSPWNRTTVADGYWLQSKTVDPFSARDIYLANCIDDAINRISDVETAISAGTTNSLESMNNVIYDDNNYWEELPATIAPSNTSKAAPSNSLTYMTLGVDSDVATEDINLQNDRTCLIQGNLTENSFNQILLTDSGMFYRSVSGNETTSMTGDKVDSYNLLETDKAFAQILDDSTIDDPGYWFLHKESSGRPVWTNINALGEYIDNRVNPDNVYIGWQNFESELPERKLVLLPPTTANTTTAINPTDETYTNNAYAWSESGWVALEPLMSREEIIERIEEGGGSVLPDYTSADAGKVLTVNSEGDGLEWAEGGGGGGEDASLRDFLALFTITGADAYYTNFGPWLQSEIANDGKGYFGIENSSPSAFTIDSNVGPSTDGVPRPHPSRYPGTTAYDFGTPRWIRTCSDYIAGVSGAYIPWDSCSASININDVTNGATTTAVFNKVLITTENHGSMINYPVYIKLAPFTYLNEEGDTNDPQKCRRWNNVARDWHIHFCIEGSASFTTGDIDLNTYRPSPAARADVSICLLPNSANANNITANDIGSVNYYTQSKTFYINEGDYVTNPSAMTAFSAHFPGGGVHNGIVSLYKEIDFHESFPGCVISDKPSNYEYYEPWLRICLKGIVPVKGGYDPTIPGTWSLTPMTSAERLGINIMGDATTGAGGFKLAGERRFIEEFEDDRFMEFAYRYINNQPTRMLSYTDENNAENLLGTNTANPALTANTNILAQ